MDATSEDATAVDAAVVDAAVVDAAVHDAAVVDATVVDATVDAAVVDSGNTDACTAESNQAFCGRLQKTCGHVVGTDNCGVTRDVADCGTCALNQTCDTTNRCTLPTYTLGGVVSGLAGSGLVLSLSGTESLPRTSNGSYTFAKALDNGSSYIVVVQGQPTNPWQTCTTTTNAQGTINLANVTDVNVACTTNRYDVGGTINGLVGAGLVLQNNASDDLAPTADGTFTFPTKVASNTNYAVTIATQPSGQTCSVAAGDGKVTGQAVTTVQIECSTNAYSVGGTVTGLAGTGLHLKDTVSNQVVDVGGTSFAIGSFLSGASYNIVVDQNPTSKWQTCSTTANGSGTVGDGDISNVTVNCTTNQYHLSGTITGLLGSGIVLSNLTQTTTLAALATTFSFTRALDSGVAYTVTVTTSPTHPTQHCTLSSSSGVVAGADISNVEISCTTTPFRIGGSVTGLLGTGLMLQNNGGDDLPIPTNGAFTFTSTVLDHHTYAVTVLAQPESPWQTCLTSSSAGTVENQDITNVGIHCTTKTYAVGGSISGLSSTAGITLTLINNADSSTIASALLHNNQSATVSVSSSVSFTLTTTQPTDPWQTCSISHSTDTVTGTAISDVNVTCTTNHYTVGGTVTGMTGSGLVLRNGSDDLAVSGSFTFPTTVASSSTYAVTVVTQPTNPWQNCTVSNGTGTVTGTPITHVAVSCTTNSYNVNGTVSGLVSTGTGITVTLEGTAQSRTFTSTNGYTPFSVLSGATYTVVTTTNPTNPWQTCSVANPTGTVGGTAITDVNITCTTNHYTVGGTVTGLLGSGLVLKNNGTDDLPISVNGPFTFTTTVASSSTYAVTVVTQPTTPSQPARLFPCHQFGRLLRSSLSAVAHA